MPRRQHNKKKKVPPANRSLATASTNAVARTPNDIECQHGCPPPRLGHYDPTADGMRILMNHLALSGREAAVKMLQDCPACLNETTLKVLASTGTNCFLNDGELRGPNPRGQAELMAVKLAEIILIFENVVPPSSGPQSNDAFMNKQDQKWIQDMLNLDSRRKLAKFYAKRIPCNCLDDVKQAARDDRTGKCNSCWKTAEDASLLNCSACGLVKYCSKECQVEDWSKHKNGCKLWRNSKQMAKDTSGNSDDDKADLDSDIADGNDTVPTQI